MRRDQRMSLGAEHVGGSRRRDAFAHACLLAGKTWWQRRGEKREGEKTRKGGGSGGRRRKTANFGQTPRGAENVNEQF